MGTGLGGEFYSSCSLINSLAPIDRLGFIVITIIIGVETILIYVLFSILLLYVRTQSNNCRIFQGAHSDFSGPTSGSTAVVALVRGDKIVVANAGDSRCVLARGGKVRLCRNVFSIHSC